MVAESREARRFVLQGAHSVGGSVCSFAKEPASSCGRPVALSAEELGRLSAGISRHSNRVGDSVDPRLVGAFGQFSRRTKSFPSFPAALLGLAGCSAGVFFQKVFCSAASLRSLQRKRNGVFLLERVFRCGDNFFRRFGIRSVGGRGWNSLIEKLGSNKELTLPCSCIETKSSDLKAMINGAVA